MAKYKKLIVLVHPLFYYLKKYEQIRIRDKVANKPTNAFNETKGILKATLGEYGKIINKYRNKEDVCFCIVDPNETIPDRYIKTIYETNFNKLVSFAEEVIGKDRFRYTRFETHGSDPATKILFEKSFYKNFNPEIQIIGFGEYTDACVKWWTRDYIPEELKKHKIIVTKKTILPRSSISKDAILDGIKISKHKKRMEQQRIKALKTNNKSLVSMLNKKTGMVVRPK